MASKRNKNEAPVTNNRMGSIEWFNVNLSVEDVAAIDAWLTTEPDVLGEICRLVVEGYGIALKPANRGDGFMCTLTLQPSGGNNSGGGLSAFADTPYEAAAALLFKFVFKLDGDISSAGSASKSRFR